MSDSWKNFQEKELISIGRLLKPKIVVWLSEKVRKWRHLHWTRLLERLFRSLEGPIVEMRKGKWGFKSILDFYSIQKWTGFGSFWWNQWSKIDYSRYKYVDTISTVQSEDSKQGCPVYYYQHRLVHELGIGKPLEGAFQNFTNVRTPYSKPKDAINLASSNDANSSNKKFNPTKAWASIYSTNNPNSSCSTYIDIYKSIYGFRYENLVILEQYAARLLKSCSAPIGISNPAFTMNEYYPIHLTPPGQGPPNSPFESEVDRKTVWWTLPQGYPVISSPEQLATNLTRDYSMMEIDQKTQSMNWKSDQWLKRSFCFHSI